MARIVYRDEKFQTFYADVNAQHPEITIGRNPGNSLVIPAKSLSRQHAKILFQGSKYFLIDLKSSNGTRVNDQRVTYQEIHPGDKIMFGDVNVEFVEDVRAGMSFGAPAIPQPGKQMTMSGPPGQMPPSSPLIPPAPKQAFGGSPMIAPERSITISSRPISAGGSFRPTMPNQPAFDDDMAKVISEQMAASGSQFPGNKPVDPNAAPVSFNPNGMGFITGSSANPPIPGAPVPRVNMGMDKNMAPMPGMQPVMPPSPRNIQGVDPNAAPITFNPGSSMTAGGMPLMGQQPIMPPSPRNMPSVDPNAAPASFNPNSSFTQQQRPNNPSLMAPPPAQNSGRFGNPGASFGSQGVSGQIEDLISAGPQPTKAINVSDYISDARMDPPAPAASDNYPEPGVQMPGMSGRSPEPINYGEPQNFGGQNYGAPQNFGGQNYGESQNFGGQNYGESQNFGGQNYGESQNFGGQNYGESQNFGGQNYGGGRNDAAVPGIEELEDDKPELPEAADLEENAGDAHQPEVSGNDDEHSVPEPVDNSPVSSHEENPPADAVAEQPVAPDPVPELQEAAEPDVPSHESAATLSQSRIGSRNPREMMGPAESAIQSRRPMRTGLYNRTYSGEMSQVGAGAAAGQQAQPATSGAFNRMGRAPQRQRFGTHIPQHSPIAETIDETRSSASSAAVHSRGNAGISSPGHPHVSGLSSQNLRAVPSSASSQNLQSVSASSASQHPSRASSPVIAAQSRASYGYSSQNLVPVSDDLQELHESHVPGSSSSDSLTEAAHQAPEIISSPEIDEIPEVSAPEAAAEAQSASAASEVADAPDKADEILQPEHVGDRNEEIPETPAADARENAQILEKSGNEPNESNHADASVESVQPEVSAAENAASTQHLLDEANARNDDILAELNSLRAELESKHALESEIADLKAELESKRALEDEIAGLRNALEAKRELEADMASLRLELESKQSLETEVASLKSELEAKRELEADMASLRLELESKQSLEAENAALKSELESKHSLETELDSLRAELEVNRGTDIDSMKSEMEMLRQTGASVQTLRDELRQTRADRDNAVLQNERLNAEMQTIRAELEQSQNQCGELTNQLEQNKQNLQQLQDSLDQANLESSSASVLLTKSHSQILALQERLDKSMAERDEAVQQLASASQLPQVSQDELAQIRAERDEANQKLEQIDASIKAQVEEIQAQNLAEIARIKDECSQSVEDVKARCRQQVDDVQNEANARIAEIEQNFAAGESKRVELENTISELQAQIANLSKSGAQIETFKNKWTKRFNSLIQYAGAMQSVAENQLDLTPQSKEQVHSMVDVLKFCAAEIERLQ